MGSRAPRPPKTPAPLDSQSVAVKLDNDLVTRLSRIALRDSILRSDLLRRIIAEFVEREEIA